MEQPGVWYRSNWKMKNFSTFPPNLRLNLERLRSNISSSRVSFPGVSFSLSYNHDTHCLWFCLRMNHSQVEKAQIDVTGKRTHKMAESPWPLVFGRAGQFCGFGFGCTKPDVRLTVARDGWWRTFSLNVWVRSRWMVVTTVLRGLRCKMPEGCKSYL